MNIRISLIVLFVACVSNFFYSSETFNIPLGNLQSISNGHSVDLSLIKTPLNKADKKNIEFIIAGGVLTGLSGGTLIASVVIFAVNFVSFYPSLVYYTNLVDRTKDDYANYLYYYNGFNGLLAAGVLSGILFTALLISGVVLLTYKPPKKKFSLNALFGSRSEFYVGLSL